MERKRRREENKEKGERRRSRERSSTFSLDFPMIGPLVSGEARGKVLPRNKRCKQRPKIESFDKLQELEVSFLPGLIFV